MPAEIIVHYYLSSTGDLLGKEVHSGITEVQLSIPDPDGHVVSITRFFEGYQEHRWKIDRVRETTTNQTDIYLTPRADCLDEVFLSKTYRTHVTHQGPLLQKGTLVEVEYGYVQSTRLYTGEVRTNKRYPDSVQHSEMNKRRLAIVVNVTYPTVQVVPVTSVPQDMNNAAIFAVSQQSLNALHHYNDPAKSSYALAHMLQTVSIRRILPPLGVHQKSGKTSRFRSVNYPHKLTREDQKALETAITTAVGCGDYTEIRDERNRLRVNEVPLTKTIDEQAETIREMSQEMSELKARSEVMYTLLTDWQRDMNGGLSAEEANASIDEKLNEYREILGI